MIEAHRGITDGVGAILETLAGEVDASPVALAINKIDKVKSEALLA